MEFDLPNPPYRTRMGGDNHLYFICMGGVHYMHLPCLTSRLLHTSPHHTTAAEHAYESDIVILDNDTLYLYRNGTLLWKRVFPGESREFTMLYLYCHHNQCLLVRASLRYIKLQRIQWETGGILFELDLQAIVPSYVDHTTKVPSGLLFDTSSTYVPSLVLVTWGGDVVTVPEGLRYDYSNGCFSTDKTPLSWYYSTHPPFLPLSRCREPYKGSRSRHNRYRAVATGKVPSIMDLHWRVRRLDLNLALLNLPAGLAAWIGTLGAEEWDWVDHKGHHMNVIRYRKRFPR